MTVGTRDNEVFSLRFDNQDHYIAAGGYDGRVRVFSALSGFLHCEMMHVNQRTEYEKIPMVTCVRWRPNGQGTKGILMSTHTDGAINYWYPTSSRLIHQLHEDSDIYSLDISPDGSRFTTGSSDFKVRLYDLLTHTCIGELMSHGPNAPGHSSRVFSLKFAQEGNVVLSGGWDSTIHVWDVRTQRAVGALLGAYMCGDALDVQNDTVLAGSWQSKRQIQLFSLREMRKVSEVQWRVHADDTEDGSHVYSVQFAKVGPALIFAGGSRNNEARFFEAQGKNRPVGTVSNVPKAVYSVDFANTSQSAAFGSGDGCVRVLDYSLTES